LTFEDAEKGTLVAIPRHGHPGIGVGLVVGSSLPILLGAGLLALCKEAYDLPPGQDDDGARGACVPGTVFAAVGLAAVLTGGVLIATGRRSHLEPLVTPDARASGPRLQVTPSGIGAAF
jgi:hypothetical protein